MHIITLGTDEHMLDTESLQHKRLLSYATLVDRYTAIIFTRKKEWVTRQFGNLEIIELPKKGILFNLHKTYQYLKKNKRNAEESLISAQDPFEVGLIAWILSVLLRVPLHLQIHTAVQSDRARTESLRTRIQFMLFAGLRNRAKAIRVVSKSIKDFLITKGLSAEDIFVAPVIADHKQAVRTTRTPGAPIQLLSVGRFVPVKNLLNLINAFDDVVMHHDVHLTIVGGGPLYDVLVARIKHLHLENKITLTGWVTDLSEVYGRADLYVHPSYYEGFGMSTVEALTAGVPVVTTPYGGSTDYVLPHKNGYITKGFEASNIAEGIEQGIKNLVHLDPQEIKNSIHLH